jgi:protein TonB
LDPGAGPSINLLHLTPKTSTQPFYPQLAKQAHIQGVVKLNATIGKEGNVVNLTVITGHPLLVPAAFEAAKQWTYEPTLVNGAPVQTQTDININFSLPDQ